MNNESIGTFLCTGFATVLWELGSPGAWVFLVFAILFMVESILERRERQSRDRRA